MMKNVHIKRERGRGEEKGIDKDIEKITANPIYRDCPEDFQSICSW